ncbi:hypothetical protein [Halobacterium salinarum]|uniref:hypothetical protein n=1 Tax=Halobacterium salinarum TaxID=2242 RepID=UPI00255760F7|nr:hypothetical protein [Halobacterium salinarum]MDL0126304.1 hypothetical protein [Halobacterium salinarum]MDL0145848.1 hypothetical protein [Halobacterium salinarum]
MPFRDAPLDYEEYRENGETTRYSFKGTEQAVSPNGLLPRMDFQEGEIQVVQTDQFANIDGTIVDQLMYMDTRQMVSFAAEIDDPALLRSLLVELKKAHQQTEVDLHQERLDNARSEEHREELEADYIPLGAEDILRVPSENAIEKLSKDTVEIKGYDFEAVNEESTSDEVLCEFEGETFQTVPEILWGAQQKGFDSAPEKLIYHLAYENLGLSESMVEETLKDLERKNLANNPHPYHWRGSPLNTIRKYR